MILPAIAALLVAPQVARVEPVLEHALGPADASPASTFGRVSDLAADDEGNVYVLDERADELRVFSPEGEYLRTIGRRGRGPGEFSRPNDVEIFDGIITVLNPGGRSASFSMSGELVGSRTLPFGALGAARVDADLYVVYSSGAITRGDAVPTESVVLMSSSSADTLLSVPSGDVLYRGPTATSLIRTTLCRLAHFLVVSEQELWVASGIAGTIRRRRLDNGSADLAPTTRVAPEGEALPDSTRARLIGMLPRQLSAETGDVTVPAVRSSICDLQRSGTQTVWVRLADVESRERWLSVDAATLRPVSEMTAPDGVAMRAFSRGRAYGTWSDQSGVSYVGIYRLE